MIFSGISFLCNLNFNKVRLFETVYGICVVIFSVEIGSRCDLEGCDIIS
jgi:hypothetical protein